MKMYIELYASLMELLPQGKDRFRREITVNDTTNVQQVIDRFSISDELTHIVLVNGNFICGGDRNHRHIAEGYIVSIWPPVAGG